MRNTFLGGLYSQECPRINCDTRYEWARCMNSLLESMKTLLPLLAVVAVLGGFYYTTQHRLEHLENEVKAMKQEVSELNETLEGVHESVKKLSKRPNKKNKN